jgi:hypothetical protein
LLHLRSQRGIFQYSAVLHGNIWSRRAMSGDRLLAIQFIALRRNKWNLK